MKAYVVEDSRLARKELTDLLAEHTELNLVGDSGRADEAIEQINKLRPQLVFMDINMPGKDGFQVLEALDYSPRIIFVTAYADYAIKSFDYDTVDYLLKPISAERLQKALDKLQREPTQQADREAEPNYTDTPVDTTAQLEEKSRIFIKDGDQCHLVELAKIIRFESCGNYTQVYFDSKKAFVYRALSKIEERLPDLTFFRASRQHIVNLEFVTDIQPWVNGGYQLTLKNGEQIAVSRRHATRLKEILSL
ncbi:LytR/AlgR family response regulator transcription factor [Saccharophagus degradans]|uniref:LytTr DNA-binding region n=1 Tax=Saccharophagus degradans (strain 2-40 / ATCC 43961 / DSM 17024) TaxID=203122 RepID=Q21E91_SACD2|nr:LytTR family DNA-binding domain-containing protein [Saccharophagus degradans]ABD82988.1 LytTr DNA-binding region [Saccharophagus degradans 2-40]